MDKEKKEMIERIEYSAEYLEAKMKNYFSEKLREE